ncbi:MAG: zf-HC2 domain-containing protein [Anaerolineae bacterium]|nr:zf-HC2 domain-containing protein [Anaerolineae bacterium]
MQCKQASEMMSLRLDGRLDNAQVALLDAHLAECQACQAEWQSLQALDSLLASAATLEAPVRVRVQVMTRLERRDKARRAIIGGTALTLGTVALALLLMAPVLLGLLDAVGIAPALIRGGPTTLLHLLGAGETLGRTYIGLIGSLIIPLVILGLCGVTTALALNGLWIGALRRLRASR